MSSCSRLSFKHEERPSRLLANITSDRLPLVLPCIMDGHFGTSVSLCNTRPNHQLLPGQHDRRMGSDSDFG